jgi:predicted enzyme related to lactoylglutathione lyase
MSELSAYPAGAPCWVELATVERAPALEFYHGLFGWDYEVPAVGLDYSFATRRGHPVAGIRQRAHGERAVGWMTYLSVADLDVAVQSVHQLGGTVAAEPVDLGDLARTAAVVDVTGAVFGLWQPGRHPGARLAEEPGTVGFSEVGTLDASLARTFYQGLFGYELHDASAGGFEHVELRVDGRTVAALYVLGNEMLADIPPSWMNYFTVADVDMAVEIAQRRGGQVAGGPLDTEFGRMASLRDPEGAVFSVMAFNGTE